MYIVIVLLLISLALIILNTLLGIELGKKHCETRHQITMLPISTSGGGAGAAAAAGPPK